RFVAQLASSYSPRAKSVKLSSRANRSGPTSRAQVHRPLRDRRSQPRGRLTSTTTDSTRPPWRLTVADHRGFLPRSLTKPEETGRIRPSAVRRNRWEQRRRRGIVSPGPSSRREDSARRGGPARRGRAAHVERASSDARSAVRALHSEHAALGPAGP